MTSSDRELKNISRKLVALDREKQSLLQRQQVLLKSNVLPYQEHKTSISNLLSPGEKVALFFIYERDLKSLARIIDLEKRELAK